MNLFSTVNDKLFYERGDHKMNALLIDDEQLALDYLERQLQKIRSIDIEIIGKYTYFNLEKNKEILHNVDLIFLDVEMSELNGLELAERFLEINPALMIVFVTAQIADYRPKTIQWRTSKAKELFLYLLYREGNLVLKEDLAELLWPDFNPERSYAQLYTAIYHIRKALQPYSDHLTIKNKKDNYLLLTNNVSIDVIEWEKEIRLFSTVTKDNIEKVEEIMNSYEGPFLQSYHFVWAEPERYRLEQLWFQIAYKIAHFYKEKDPEQAENWYRQICELRPEEEEAHFALMKLYHLFGYGVLIDYQYAQLERELASLELEVSNEVKEWYTDWKERT